VTLANGSNIIYARATDTSYNTGETSITVTYNPPPDTTTPTISITCPASGQVFSTDTITVNGTASDNIALSKVEVKVGSESWQTASGTTSWSKQVTLANGSNIIYARATDTSYNTGETSITVTYNPPPDTTTPTISITCPASGQVFSTDTITVNGTASDNIALSKVEVKLNSGSWQTATGTTSWSTSVTLANGSNIIYARATDTSYNTGETSITVTYNPPPDTTTPTISITCPASGQVFSTDTITVNGTASDNIALSKVEVKLNSGSWQTATGTTSWSTSVTLANGSNIIYARANDTSDNTNETSVTVTYNPLTFDTGSGTYPSISGTHNGTLTPSSNVNVSHMYTYPCAGTGGHAEYVKIWNSTWDTTATWSGYSGDYHNLTFDEPFILRAGETYNYMIKTGSYPQIVHATSKAVTGGTITCTEFVDVNGVTYDDWIPAIRLG
ncbi:MAG: Ig-like domain-containing protein, partial [Methanocellales archaeon]|nr:Ig-like domain-containing protein [Methanocellales archaeon]